ncbi:Ribonuclease P protein component [Trichinella pseudospiralis]
MFPYNQLTRSYCRKTSWHDLLWKGRRFNFPSVVDDRQIALRHCNFSVRSCAKRQVAALIDNVRPRLATNGCSLLCDRLACRMPPKKKKL